MYYFTLKLKKRKKGTVYVAFSGFKTRQIWHILSDCALKNAITELLVM